MLEIKKKRIKQDIITEAFCDCCNTRINHLSFLGNLKISTDLYDNDFSGSVDGALISYTAGYGTEYDSESFQVVLCTRCLVKNVFSLNKINGIKS